MSEDENSGNRLETHRIGIKKDWLVSRVPGVGFEPTTMDYPPPEGGELGLTVGLSHGYDETDLRFESSDDYRPCRDVAGQLIGGFIPFPAFLELQKRMLEGSLVFVGDFRFRILTYLGCDTGQQRGARLNR